MSFTTTNHHDTEAAIGRSTSHDEIVTIVVTDKTTAEEVLSKLQSAALAAGLDYDDVESGDTTEVWAGPQNSDEMTWRVHVQVKEAEVTEDQVAALEMEAGEAGDLMQVALCQIALKNGVHRDTEEAMDPEEFARAQRFTRREAREQCEEAIRAAGR